MLLFVQSLVCLGKCLRILAEHKGPDPPPQWLVHEMVRLPLCLFVHHKMDVSLSVSLSAAKWYISLSLCLPQSGTSPCLSLCPPLHGTSPSLSLCPPQNGTSPCLSLCPPQKICLPVYLFVCRKTVSPCLSLCHITYTHTHTHTQMHTRMCTHTHTHAHTHARTHALRAVPVPCVCDSSVGSIIISLKM